MARRNNKRPFPTRVVSFGLIPAMVVVRQAMEEMNGKELGGEEIEIVLAKPPDKKRKERQAARQTTRNTG